MAVATTLTNSMKIFHRCPQLLQYAKRNLSSTKKMDLYTEDYLKVNTYRSRREDWLRNLQSVQEVKDNLIETIAKIDCVSEFDEIGQLIRIAETDEDKDFVKEIVLKSCQLNNALSKYIIFVLFSTSIYVLTVSTKELLISL